MKLRLGFEPLLADLPLTVIEPRAKAWFISQMSDGNEGGHIVTSHEFILKMRVLRRRHPEQNWATLWDSVKQGPGSNLRDDLWHFVELFERGGIPEA